MEEYDNNLIKFWVEEESNSSVSIKIDIELFLRFLEQQGFGKMYLGNNSTFLRIKKNIISQVTTEQIKDYVFDWIKSAPNNLTNKSSNKQIRNSLIRGNHIYFGKNNLQILEVVYPKINTDTINTAFFYFQNGFVKVSSNDLNIYDYSELEQLIWEEQIIQRKLHLSNDTSDFESFIRKVCNEDENRYKSLTSAIGYLLHSYKDPTITKAIIFLDEIISSNPNGRTGKSLVTKAIGKLKKMVTIDGKNFSFNDRFLFQRVNLDTQIINFNDVKANFNFEVLFSILTDSITVEKKGQKAFDIPYGKSPKVIITTNYSILGEGESFKDRMFEIEFWNYYNSQHTPIDDFGKKFFNDWNESQWNSFFTFMLKCVRFYLANGLVHYKHINLERKKLEQITSPEFCSFADRVERGVELNKKNLFTRFFIDNPEITYKQKTFDSYLKAYARSMEINIKERDSAGSRFITLGMK